MYIAGGESLNAETIAENAILVPKALPGRCAFCPRKFETGERIVFFTRKKRQMRVMNNEEGISEVVEHHTIQIENGHLDCVTQNKDSIRAIVPKQAITKGKF
jgi:hypothetical protein